MNELTGADVAELRRRRGYSLDDLASIVGWSARTLGLIETGGAWLNDELVDKLVLLGAVPGAGGSTTPAAEPTPVSEEPNEAVGPSRPVRRFSNSEIQTFKRCRRKWWLAWNRGLTPKTESPVGVRQIGNRIHRAMEVGYAPGGPYRERLLSSLEHFIAQDRDAVGYMDEITKSQFENEANLERIMLEGYAEWLEETGADANLEVLSAEQYVEAKLPAFDDEEFDVYIIGRLDVLVRRKSDGAIAFIDHKTVASFADLVIALPMNEQSKHYQLLQWMTNPAEERVTGVIFNYLRRVKRTAKATPPFYAREEVTHNRPTMEAYYDRLLGEIRAILDVEEALERGISHQIVAFPTVLPERCRWDCEFFRQCSMFDDGSRVEDAISAQFVVGDPLAYYDRDKEMNE